MPQKSGRNTVNRCEYTQERELECKNYQTVALMSHLGIILMIMMMMRRLKVQSRNIYQNQSHEQLF